MKLSAGCSEAAWRVELILSQAFLLFLGLPLALASWWCYLFFLPIFALFFNRTAREDHMLQDGLAGYPEYSQRV